PSPSPLPVEGRGNSRGQRVGLRPRSCWLRGSAIAPNGQHQPPTTSNQKPPTTNQEEDAGRCERRVVKADVLSALKPLAPSRLPGLNRLSPRIRRWVVWGAGLWLFYTIAGFLIVPPIVRAVAAGQLSKQLNRKVSIAKVKLNPYTMSATIRGF